MRFVVEALGLTAGGGKQLALDLFVHLARHTRHEFVLLLPDLPEYPEVAAANLKRIACPKPRSLPARYRFLNHNVPGICVEQKADALLCLGNFAPRRPPCPTVVLLHNAHLVYFEPVAENRLTLREKLTRRYGRYALHTLSPQARVVVQTPIMRQRLLEQHGFDAGKIDVIPNSCFFPAVTRRSAAPGGAVGGAGCSSIRAKEGGEPWEHGGAETLNPRRGERKAESATPADSFTFLCLTEYYAHKNLEILVEAMKALPRFVSHPARCLITISPSQHPRARRLLQHVSQQSAQGRVVNIGPVARERLGEVYGSADALILPTLLESFSRTYFEAMHFGLPILTSDRDFARHICQDAALYFEPLDADSVARSMAHIMEDGELRAKLARNGKRLLNQSPTWDEIAAQFVGVLEQTAGCRSFMAAPGRARCSKACGWALPPGLCRWWRRRVRWS